jgi:hypothetical protein
MNFENGLSSDEEPKRNALLRASRVRKSEVGADGVSGVRGAKIITLFSKPVCEGHRLSPSFDGRIASHSWMRFRSFPLNKVQVAPQIKVW